MSTRHFIYIDHIAAIFLQLAIHIISESMIQCLMTDSEIGNTEILEAVRCAHDNER